MMVNVFIHIESMKYVVAVVWLEVPRDMLRAVYPDQVSHLLCRTSE